MPPVKSCVRLCSTETLFSNKEARSDQQHLSGVILLNSPEHAQWSCKEYFRLWRLYRGQRHPSSPPQDRPICYFICADGAFDILLHYYYTHYEELCSLGILSDVPGKAQGTDAAVPLPPFPLCDIIIGDMDSSKRFKKYMDTCTIPGRPCKDFSETEHLPPTQKPQLPFLTTGNWYNHIKEIPSEMLEEIRARALALAQGSIDGEYSTLESCLPYLFPITCQMSTDFMKSILILRRLKRRYPCDFPEYCDNGVPLWRDPANTMRPFIDCVENADNDHEVMTQEERNPTVTTALLMQTHIQRFRDAMQGRIDFHEAHVKATTHCNEQKIKYNEITEDANDAEATRLEHMRCADLLNEVWKDSMLGCPEGGSTHGAPSLRICIMPNIAILGSLGGRFDQEISSVSSLFSFSNEFHMVLTNKWNVMFPCVSNGITLWLHSSPHEDGPNKAKGAPQTVQDDTKNNGNKTAEPNGCNKNLPVPKEDQIQFLDREGDVCGIIPFGKAEEMETTGFLYNIVKGRSGPPLCRYDGVTQTEQLDFSFSGIVSTSNTAVEPLMLVDTRILSHMPGDACLLHGSPPTLLTTTRLSC